MAISIYDMDRTITRSGTWAHWLAFWVKREAPWRVVLLPLLLLLVLGHAARLVSRGQLKALCHLVLMGRRLPRARVAAAAQAYAERVVAENLFEGALAQIAADRAEGRTLLLATASNAYYAEAIGARLGMAAVVATPSRWLGDTLDWRLGGENCYGKAKRGHLAAWLAGHGALDARLRFYSDHVSDLPVFELALASGGEAVAANPSPALRDMAQARGWRIVDWGKPKASLFERA